MKLKIVYISGHGRSGSTLLAALLGRVDGFCTIGEGRYLINHKMRSKHLPCSCGKQIEDCAFWNEVISGINTETITFATKQLRTRHLPRLILLGQTGHLQGVGWRRLTYTMWELYHRITEKYGGISVIVDAAKHPSHGYMLGQVAKQYEDIELYIIHLVRDARGVVGSWITPKGNLPSRHPLKVCLTWLNSNFWTESLRWCGYNYLLVRYEDFVMNPVEHLNAILKFVGEDTKNAAGLASEATEAAAQHILAGNPEKFTWSGNIVIQERKWHLSPALNSLVVTLTWPLLCRYGYVFPSQKNRRVNSRKSRDEEKNS